MKKETLPYIPIGWEVFYVPRENEFMRLAEEVAKKYSTDVKHSTGAVVVKEGKIIGKGANVSWFHKHLGCVRKGLRNLFLVPSGKMYWSCPGCSPKFHAEQTALRDVLRRGANPKGAELYLWGHWWCCESCWEKMIDAGIEKVFLVEGADVLFGKSK